MSVFKFKMMKDEKKCKKTIAVVLPIAFVCVAFIIVLSIIIIPKSRKYNAAVALMNEGNIADAYESLIALNGYKDSEIKASEIFNQYINTAQAGDTVYFGAYEQDNNTFNGKENVEWIVLAKEDRKALAISKYALDCQRYNLSVADVTWENCSLRTWLNGTFLNSAFSSDEQARIAASSVSEDKNPEYSTNPGNAAKDKVFLLSITEAEKYFSTDESRKCAPTAYAKAHGAYTGDSNNTEANTESTWWWVRTPGIYQNYAAYINLDGSVNYDGYTVYAESDAVRPALWIDLS